LGSEGEGRGETTYGKGREMGGFKSRELWWTLKRNAQEGSRAEPQRQGGGQKKKKKNPDDLLLRERGFRRKN